MLDSTPCTYCVPLSGIVLVSSSLRATEHIIPTVLPNTIISTISPLHYSFIIPTLSTCAAVPTTPGNSRLFFAMYAVAAVGGSRWPTIFQILDMKPRWMDFLGHFSQHAVLDGDSVFLHQQVGSGMMH